MSIACPICAATTGAKVYRVGEYAMMHCPKCDIVHADPMSSDLEYYKESADYAFRDNIMLDPLRWDYRWEMVRFLNAPPRSSGTLLDIGCGTGFFVKRAIEMGFDAYGTDFNDHSIERGREHFELSTIHACDIGELIGMYPGIKLHVVTMFHLLEHLEDPVALMQQLKPALAPDARIVIALPYRERWPDPYKGGDEPPHHLTRWSPKALRHFLDQNGYRVDLLEIESFGLRNMPTYIYQYVLKLAPFLTMKGSTKAEGRTGEAAEEIAPRITPEQAVQILSARKRKMYMAKVVSFPLWVALRMFGARGPNFYVEASLKG
jgi:2-polyprenyl-3-methyl-5-hydroxy-6-metoxy-1,4-benzoquinol methylase